MVDGIESTYQQMKDVVTLLRCYYTEYRVEMSQFHWLQNFFRNNQSLVTIDMNQFLEKLSQRLCAMSRIQKHTLQHAKSLLQSPKHSSAERTLICQLLVDIETSLSTVTSESQNLYHQAAFPSDQRHLAALLCENRDYNGALTLLHRVPLAQISKKDLERMEQLSVDLWFRLWKISQTLGIYEDLVALDIYEFQDPLILPYSLLAAHSNQSIDNEAFIKKSFMWPWIRDVVLEHLEYQLEAPLNWKPTDLNPLFRDAFGHTVLHAAFLSQDSNHLQAIIEKMLKGGINQHMATKSPFYAPGLTPLACSAGPKADWKAFQAVLLFSDKSICCGSDGGTQTHGFCALAIAARNHEYAVVKALIERSTQQNVDISNCCRWAFSNIPTISIQHEIWSLLAQVA
ncbi:hypothetical protein F5883DRAFT_247627 [Diaporthe sp. PMI_573]|nr:hypothetical protein F5883DRAFT_247627 [Diaporthaceae sp. PMI_573]